MICHLAMQSKEVSSNGVQSVHCPTVQALQNKTQVKRDGTHHFSRDWLWLQCLPMIWETTKAVSTAA